MGKTPSISKNIKLWQELASFYFDLGAQKPWIWLAILLGTFSLLANIGSFIFLIPLLQGMITHDFAFLDQSPFIRIILLNSPEVFASYESRFVLLVSIVFLLALSRSLALYFSRVISVRQVYVVDKELKDRLFERYLRFNKNYYDKHSTGSIYYTLMQESKRVSDQLKNLTELCLKILTMAAYFAVLVSISLELSVVTFLVFGFMGVFANRVVERVKHAIQKFHFYEKKISDRTHDTILCIPTVKTFGKEQQEMEYFRQTNANTAALAVEGQILHQVINPIKEVFSLVALLFIAFALSLIDSHLHGGKTIPHYLVFFMIVRFSAPIFNQISQHWVSIMTAEKALENLKTILHKYDPNYMTFEGELVLPGIIHKIEFKNINLQLGNRTIFKNLSLEIPIRKRVGVVGASGIGKTTIVNLLLREYDFQGGRIEFDGKDIEDYTAESIKRQFSVVSQDTFLFETTILKNMLYGAQTAISELDIQRAIEKSQLTEFINKLPDGLDTMLGERGLTVSGGEKQRIVIARAFLRNSPIMIFDEPTSSLDYRSEMLVRDAIFATTFQRTAIIITHKLNVIRDVDQVILFLKNGQTMAGTFEELLEKSEEFRNAWHKELEENMKLSG